MEALSEIVFLMQIIGYILIIFAVADFGLSWVGINLTPFLPNQIATFTPIVIGGIGYLFLNANSGTSKKITMMSKKDLKIENKY